MPKVFLYISSFLLFWFQEQDTPVFKGGNSALEDFIGKNIIYPSFSRSNCIEGTIHVRFELDTLGNVTKTEIVRGLGIDLDEEAERVIKLTSGKWTVNPQNVKTFNMVLPVKFSLQNRICNTVTDTDRKRAIEYYQIQEALQNTVFNYYQNKEKGEANDKSESEIIRLKEQLGFDDEFVESKMNEAKKMLAQKDINGACKTLKIIKNIGSNAADKLIEQYCN